MGYMREGWGMVEGENLCNPLEMGAEMKWRTQQVVHSQVGDETGGLNLEEQRERLRSAVSLIAFLAGLLNTCNF